MKFLILALIFSMATTACNKSNDTEKPESIKDGVINNDDITIPPPQLSKEAIIGEEVSTRECNMEFVLEDICANTKWLIGPNSEGQNSFLIQFYNKEGDLVAPQHQVDSVAVLIWNDKGEQGKKMDIKVEPVF